MDQLRASPEPALPFLRPIRLSAAAPVAVPLTAPKPQPEPEPTEKAAEPATIEPARYERAVMEADYLALQNDLEQAQALANELQGQLADKSNELGMLKVVWERAQKDLEKLNQNILTLRQERHRIAGELQLTEGFKAELERSRAECKQLRLDLIAERHRGKQALAESERKLATLRDLLNQVRIQPGSVGAGVLNEAIAPSEELAAAAATAPEPKTEEKSAAVDEAPSPKIKPGEGFDINFVS